MCRLASLHPNSLPPHRSTHWPDPTDLELRYNIIHKFELRYARKVQCQLIRSHSLWKERNLKAFNYLRIEPRPIQVKGFGWQNVYPKQKGHHHSHILNCPYLALGHHHKDPPLPTKQTNGRALWYWEGWWCTDTQVPYPNLMHIFA